MRVLGIDPGVATMGYGVVERAGSKPRALAFGVIRTSAGETQARRLMALRDALGEIMRRHRPEEVAVERLFFTSNAKTAMAVGQASGVALATAAEAGLAVSDYTPNEVKQSVVGFGGASKAQVQVMVAAVLGLAEPPRPPDAADACALAICHLNRSGLRAAVGRAAP
ncbi:MAG: crossover junction endodeoxyribonuclease RuvC [Actinomycetota bacterium]